MSEGVNIGGPSSPPGPAARQMRPFVSAAARFVTRVWNHCLSLVSREHVLSLADQGVVSGASFLSTLLIARWGGASQLGVYALGMSLLLSLLAFQEFSHRTALFDSKVLSRGTFC